MEACYQCGGVIRDERYAVQLKMPHGMFWHHKSCAPQDVENYMRGLYVADALRRGREPSDVEETEKPTRKEPMPDPKKTLAESVEDTLSNIRDGAKIGGAGEVTILCVSMAETLLGRKIPVPEFFENHALSELSREMAGVMVLKVAVLALSGKQSKVITEVVRLAEIDIGVRVVHAMGPSIRQKASEFMERAEELGIGGA